jgi:hypothetical protein
MRPLSLAWLPIWLAGSPQSLAISGPLYRMVVEIVDQALSENEGHGLFKRIGDSHKVVTASSFQVLPERHLTTLQDNLVKILLCAVGE